MGISYDLSVVIPGYNEEKNLTQTLQMAKAVLPAHTEKIEWILVDDGSTDGMWREIEGLADSDPHVIPVRHETNKGLGAAVWTGMRHASLEWCTWMPADGQISPEAIVEMMQLTEEAELIILMRDSEERNWWRQLLTAGMYQIMRFLIGFNPYGYSGVYLTHRDIIQPIPLQGWTAVQNFAVVIHCQKNNYRIRQTPTVIQPRLSGKSKVANFRTMLKVFYEIVKLKLKPMI